MFKLSDGRLSCESMFCVLVHASRTHVCELNQGFAVCFHYGAVLGRNSLPHDDLQIGPDRFGPSCRRSLFSTGFGALCRLSTVDLSLHVCFTGCWTSLLSSEMNVYSLPFLLLDAII